MAGIQIQIALVRIFKVSILVKLLSHTFRNTCNYMVQSRHLQNFLNGQLLLKQKLLNYLQLLPTLLFIEHLRLKGLHDVLHLYPTYLSRLNTSCSFHFNYLLLLGLGGYLMRTFKVITVTVTSSISSGLLPFSLGYKSLTNRTHLWLFLHIFFLLKGWKIFFLLRSTAFTIMALKELILASIISRSIFFTPQPPAVTVELTNQQNRFLQQFSRSWISVDLQKKWFDFLGSFINALFHDPHLGGFSLVLCNYFANTIFLEQLHMLELSFWSMSIDIWVDNPNRFPQGGIKKVLHPNFRPSLQLGSNEGPLISILLLHLEDLVLLWLWPLRFPHNAWSEVIVPSNLVEKYLSSHCLGVL